MAKKKNQFIIILVILGLVYLSTLGIKEEPKKEAGTYVEFVQSKDSFVIGEVNFRVSDINYGLGSTISFRTGCGTGDLNTYSLRETRNNINFWCDSSNLILSDLPMPADMTFGVFSLPCKDNFILRESSRGYVACCNTTTEAGQGSYNSFTYFKTAPIGTEPADSIDINRESGICGEGDFTTFNTDANLWVSDVGCNNNGVKEGLEECDGSDFGISDCAREGFSYGNLNCNSCIIDTSSCSNSLYQGTLSCDTWGSPVDCNLCNQCTWVEGADYTTQFCNIDGSSGNIEGLHGPSVDPGVHCNGAPVCNEDVTDATFDFCEDGTSCDANLEYVKDMSVSGKAFNFGDDVTVGCTFVPDEGFETDDNWAIYYKPGTVNAWQLLDSGTLSPGDFPEVTKEVTFTVNPERTRHVVRCSICYGVGCMDECPTGNFKDSDDMHFLVNTVGTDLGLCVDSGTCSAYAGGGNCPFCTLS